MLIIKNLIFILQGKIINKSSAWSYLSHRSIKGDMLDDFLDVVGTSAFGIRAPSH